MNEHYLRTVGLLLDVAPYVFTSGCFALKGGTAINFFVQDMPRLSVDIDLVYTDHKTDRRQAILNMGAEFAVIQRTLESRGIRAEVLRTRQGEESKLLVSNVTNQIKVEINHVFRGMVLPIETRVLTKAAEDRFDVRFSVPTLAMPELYGGKLVAAMDRQHPRDLFDVLRMYEYPGLTDGIVECFVAYLAGHNRPIHEVLFSRQNALRDAFNSEFLGMTNVPVTLPELEAAGERLRRELPAALTDRHRRFLVSLAACEPDWSLMACPHLRELPGIRWKLLNLEKLRTVNPEKFRQQRGDLDRQFSMLDRT